MDATYILSCYFFVEQHAQTTRMQVGEFRYVKDLAVNDDPQVASLFLRMIEDATRRSVRTGYPAVLWGHTLLCYTHGLSLVSAKNSLNDSMRFQ